MSVTGTSLINKVATILYDGNNVRWSRAELLGWLNDAQRALTVLLPDAASTRVSQQMVAGPRQNIPAAGWLLLEVPSNMGGSGAVRGRSLRRMDRATFDEVNPTWMSDQAAAEVTTYTYDSRDRTSFYVYPPSDGTGFLEIIYSATPVDLATEAGTIGVMDLYTPALTDYMLYRAKSKSSNFGSPDQAKAYFDSFQMYVGAAGGNISSATGGPE